MSEILNLSYSSLLLITFSSFTLSAFSQDVTNDSAFESSVSSIGKINESRNITIIDTVGDIECSKNLHDRLKNDNPTIFIALGDLCYKRDLTNFTNTYSDFKRANRLACVIGNHDSERMAI